MERSKNMKKKRSFAWLYPGVGKVYPSADM